MERIYIKEAIEKEAGTEITIIGWVHEIRDQSKIKFILLRDMTGIMQVIAFDKNKFFEKIPKLSRESVIEIKGILKDTKQAPNGKELELKEFKIIAESNPELPIPVIEKGDQKTVLAKRLDYRFLDLHKPKVQAIFKIESEIMNSFRKYFYNQGFIEANPPCIISSASEGGTELFPAKYFEQDAYLAQSPQLYKQMIATSIEKTFMIVPVWRAERHNTIRHINEARQMDIEMAFSDDFEVMKELTKAVQYMVKNVIEKCQDELKLLDKNLKIPEEKYITYEETINLLKKNGMDVDQGDDLSTELERKLCELFPDTVVFVHSWPLEIKPFYIMPKTLNKDEKTSKGFDAIYGGMEISSGGQRVHIPELLIERLKEKGLNPKYFEYYINSFKYGAPPHSGWSIGLERFSMVLLGLNNIREATLFPRDRDRLVP